jgi:predicted phage terminase large subunit-like protein
MSTQNDAVHLELHNPELQQLLQSGYKLTPLTLGIRLSYGRYKAARHLLYASSIISSAVARGNARIIFSMPPRHGKSEFCSHYLPTWFLELWPDQRVLLATYGAELSRYFSRKVRDEIQAAPDTLSVRIRDDASGVSDFLTTEGGGLLSAGIGGPITGRGFNIGLIDDYIKNAEDSLSPLQLQKTWDWFLSTFYTRAEPNASIIIFATRWNVDDLIARCKRELAHEEWIVIDLPAIAFENDPLGRAVGDPLWPERFDLKALERISLTLGDYWWSAMYQQQPKVTMHDGSRGDKIHIIDPSQVPPLTDLRIIRSWDFAATQATGKNDPDYTVGGKIGISRTTGRVIILDLPRFREGPGRTQELVISVTQGDGYSVPIIMEQEPGSSGKTFIENYRTRVLPGFKLDAGHPTGPIEFRASPFLAAIDAGRVSMIRAPWNDAVKKECNTFPMSGPGIHDDIISSLSQGYNKLVLGQTGSVIWGNTSDPRIVRSDPLRDTNRSPNRIITGVTW